MKINSLKNNAFIGTTTVCLIAPFFVATANGGTLSLPSENYSLNAPTNRCSKLFVPTATEAKSNKSWLGQVMSVSSRFGGGKTSLATRTADTRSENADLFGSVLHSLVKPDGFQNWLKENMYSDSFSKLEPTLERSIETGLGLSESQTTDYFRLSLYSTHPTLAESKARNGLVIVLIRLGKNDSGTVLNWKFSGNMTQDYYFIFDGKRYDEALAEIRNLKPKAKFNGDWSLVSNVGGDAAKASSTMSVFNVSKGRVIVRNGPYAGSIQYTEGDQSIRYDNRYGETVAPLSKYSNAELYEIAVKVTRKVQAAMAPPLLPGSKPNDSQVLIK